MAKAATIEPRGLLNPKTGEKKFHLTLHPPSVDLSLFIEHYWVVRWDLRGQEPYLSENLSHPAVHLVIENGRSKIFGVVTGKFSNLIKDKGWVFGIKFRPGAFYPFAKMPVSTLADNSVGLFDVFGADGLALEAEILALDDEIRMVEAAERFIRARLPEPDDTLVLINHIVETIMMDGSIIKVDNLVDRFNLSKRSIQRIFNQYVGASPKWVIKRYRLHEAAEKLARGEVNDWPSLALSLGYFDQAHFIKDFKSIVGQTPAEYIRHL